MPTHIKASISLIALVTAILFAYIEYLAGRHDIAWVATGTGVFSVIAMWVFPEAERKKK